MSKQNKENLVIILITSVIMLIAVYSSVSNNELKDIIITLISLFAAVAVFIQIRQGTKIAKAEFVMGLQETYTNSNGFSKLFMTCWEEYKFSEHNESVEKPTSVLAFLNEDGGKEILLNYLTFFESIYLMKEQGNLDFDILDELFGRRFFIVVTNSTVQDIDLCENRKYYENVFKLYQDWFKYRKAIIKRMRLNEDEDATLKETVFLTFDKHKSNKQLLEEENEESDIN
jgi:hypothetical protein